MIQCHLVKNNSHLTAWIPAKFAQVGKYLKLIGENGWMVAEAFSTIKLDPGYVREHQRICLPSL
jgi:hypothetical protein